MPEHEQQALAETERHTVFETDRLIVAVGDVSDTDFFYTLWTEPRVMANVGYPNGLPITKSEIESKLREQQEQILDARLVIILADTGQIIGECKLGKPDAEGLSTTDVKLLPQFWGFRYGVEIKRALVDYLFRYTDCMIVEATPNINNIASIKMQEAVGGVRVGVRHFEPPEHMSDFARPVHSYVYHVYRHTWESTCMAPGRKAA